MLYQFGLDPVCFHWKRSDQIGSKKTIDTTYFLLGRDSYGYGQRWIEIFIIWIQIQLQIWTWIQISYIIKLQLVDREGQRERDRERERGREQLMYEQWRIFHTKCKHRFTHLLRHEVTKYIHNKKHLDTYMHAISKPWPSLMNRTCTQNTFSVTLHTSRAEFRSPV